MSIQIKKIPAWAVLFSVLCTLLFFMPGCVRHGHYSVEVNEEEYRELVQDYEAGVRELRTPDETLGGQLSKKILTEFVEKCPEETRSVRFLYGIDPTNEKTTLMLSFRIPMEDGTTGEYFLRNGGSEESFCPAVCEVTEAGNVSLTPTAEEYREMGHKFQEVYPGYTSGGVFDFEMLKEFLKEVPKEQVNLAFRFCTDPASGNRSVILSGALNADGTNWHLRNGGSEAAFCPINCETE